MCGIVGYVGVNNGIPLILTGLKRLEYRGYDSSGISFISKEKIHLIKKSGKVDELRQIVSSAVYSNIGIFSP